MSNPWKRLQNLLPQQPILVGTVVDDNGNGTLDLELFDGGRITVTGSGYTLGQKVFFKDGAILSTAPNLAAVDLQV